MKNYRLSLIKKSDDQIKKIALKNSKKAAGKKP